MQIGITAEEAEQRLQEKAALSKTTATEAKTEEAEEKKEDSEVEDENIPFHKHPRFLKVLAEAKEGREAKAKLVEIEKREAEKIKEAKKEFKMDPNMPFDEAMKQIKREAAEEALELFRSEQNKATETTSYYERLVSEGFDHLRDSGYKVSQKDEDAIAEIALKYKINIEAPEDIEKAYEIFDLSRKTAGAGKAKDDSVIAKDRSKTEKGPIINYSQTSWSNLGGAIGAKLGIKSDNF